MYILCIYYVYICVCDVFVVIIVEDASLLHRVGEDVHSADINLVEQVKERKEQEMKLREIQTMLLGSSKRSNRNSNSNDNSSSSSNVRDANDVVRTMGTSSLRDIARNVSLKSGSGHKLPPPKRYTALNENRRRSFHLEHDTHGSGGSEGSYKEER